MKILWSDKYTTVKQTTVRTTVVRHYDDTPDVVTYLDNETGDRLVQDMRAADGDPNGMPSHYISRHVREMYPIMNE